MSKYNIISKSGRGNIRGNKYEISYQVNNEYPIYKVTLYCFGKDLGKVGKYAFYDGSPSPKIETDKDRQEFITELKKFQQGSSYRKSHPIVMSELMKYQELYNTKSEELNQLKQQIDKLKVIELETKMKAYKKEIDRPSLNQFESDFLKLFENNRYAIIPYIYFVKNSFIIYDKELKKAVKLVSFFNNDIRIRELSDDEISHFVRYNTDL